MRGAIVAAMGIACCAGMSARAAETERKPAVVIAGKEISDAIAEVPTSGVKDAVLRVVAVNGEYNVGLSVVRRERVNGKTVPDALQHHAITEVYEVLSGCGTLVTGGVLENAKELAADDKDVKTQIGPTAEGTAVRGGQERRIAKGDVVVIAAETPHGFRELCAEGISYVLVRVDPKRVLQTK